MKPAAATTLAIGINLASGVALLLLDETVAALTPLHAIGWWSLGSGVVLSLLTLPTGKALRDALLPGALLALTLGMAAFVLDRAGTILVGMIVGLALAVAPALSSLIRLRMPHPLHLGGLAGAALGIVVLVSTGPPDAGAILTIGGGTALAAHIISVQRVLQRHRVVGFNAAQLLVAGALLVVAAISADGGALPTLSDLPLLAAAVLVAGVALPLMRIRSVQRLTPRRARHQLPWFVVGAGAVAWLAAPPPLTVVAGTAVIAAAAWIAGGAAAEVTEAEAFRTGP